MAEKMTASQALTAQLDAIPAYLRPDFDTYATMKNAAAVVSQAQQAAVIYQMLGIGAAYDQGPAPR